jgi:hypothetical protein
MRRPTKVGNWRSDRTAVALIVWLAAPGPSPGAAVAGTQSLLVSYGSETECAADRVLSALVCRTAFANARAEFEIKTKAFSSQAQCSKAFGSCAPWPPAAHGASGAASFRPVFAGVEIIDTPREKSVTPIVSGTGFRFGFAPRPLTAPAPPVIPPRQAAVRPSLRPAARLPLADDAVPPPMAPPPPGSGFTIRNGVLTFPAPARYAPQNLPKQP